MVVPVYLYETLVLAKHKQADRSSRGHEKSTSYKKLPHSVKYIHENSLNIQGHWGSTVPSYMGGMSDLPEFVAFSAELVSPGQ